MRINYDVPVGWRFPRLEELTAQTAGAVKIGPFGSSLLKAELVESGIRVLGIDHVHPNELVWKKPKYISEKKYQELNQYVVSAGDVLVTNMGTVGRTCVVPTDFPTAIISSHLIRVTVDKTLVEPTYLARALNQCPIVLAQIRARCHGAIMSGFNTKLLKCLRIPLPPISDQKQIINIFDRADEIRRKRELSIKLCDQLLKSVFLEIFGDPVTNPSGWPQDRLEHLAEIRSGVAKGRKLTTKTLISVPYLRVANVLDGMISTEEMKEIEVPEGDIERYHLESGDVLLTEGGDPDKLGRGAVWHGQIEPCIHQNHIFCVRVNRTLIDPNYLSSLIGSDRGKRYFLKAAKQTTGIASINKRQLRGFPVLIPPHELQLAYADFVNRIEILTTHLRDQAEQSGCLLSSIQQMLLEPDRPCDSQ